MKKQHFKITVRKAGQKYLHELFVDGCLHYTRRTTKEYTCGVIGINHPHGWKDPSGRWEIFSMRTDPTKFESWAYTDNYKIVNVEPAKLQS